MDNYDYMLSEVSVPCWGKAINTMNRHLTVGSRLRFPSPVGVRPLTQLAAMLISSLQVSVPCWGKAINTKRNPSSSGYHPEEVSVPCWGKAINTTSAKTYKLHVYVSVPCWGKAINTYTIQLKKDPFCFRPLLG